MVIFELSLLWHIELSSFRLRLYRCSALDALSQQSGKRERCREPRGLDAEKVPKPLGTMLSGPLDHEICGRLAWACDFGSHARVSWRQSAIWQAGPIGADRGIKWHGACGIDGVINVARPLDIRSKADAAAQIERCMDAKP